ncbi:MAG: hypothetical protein WA958_01240 [Tunicatimonas sp.]
MVTSVHVRYHTPLLPPPYAYRYVLTLQPQKQAIHVRLDWTYTDRDELTEDEIVEEGFTADDDFFWEGALPLVWKKTLDDLHRVTRWVSPSDDDSLHVSVTTSNQQVAGGAPSDRPEWEYFLQETIQAVYEAAHKERPLRLAYLSVEDNSSTQLHWEASFLQRHLTLTQVTGRQRQERQLPWSELRSLLQTWYVPDYYSDKSVQDIPQQPGEYVDPGDGRWYQLGRAVINPGKPDAIGKLRTVIGRFLAPSLSGKR